MNARETWYFPNQLYSFKDWDKEAQIETSEPPAKRRRTRLGSLIPPLPRELCKLILSCLPLEDLKSCRLLSRDFRDLLDNEYLTLSAKVKDESEEIPPRLSRLRWTAPEYTRLLENMPSMLRYLELPRAQITDIQLQLLPQTLLHLGLKDCQNITNKGLEYVPRSLIYLDLEKCNITGPLSALPRSLKFLNLQQTLIQDLTGIPQSLVCLGLDRCKGLRSLENLPRTLTHLNLFDCPIGDDFVHVFPPSLKFLDLTCTRVTEVGLMKLPKGIQYLGTCQDKPFTILSELVHVTNLWISGRISIDSP